MRRFGAVLGVLLIGLATIDLPAQNPPPAGGVPPPPAPGGQRGGGRGRGAVQVMTLTTPAWKDGGLIPLRHTQAGDEVSPALAWTNVPETAASFVLIMHDIDAAIGDGTSDLLHWLVWNIPGTARQLPEGVPSARATRGRHPPNQRDGPVLSRPWCTGDGPAASLRLRTVRARRHDRGRADRRLTSRDPRRGVRRHGRQECAARRRWWGCTKGRSQALPPFTCPSPSHSMR